MKIQSIGFIETKGLIAAIVGADAMTKAANVEIIGNKYFKVKSGIVTVIVTGDVGAVKAAVEVGTEAASKVGTLITSHAIARPDEFVMRMLLPNSYEEVREELKATLQNEELKLEIKEEVKQEEIIIKINEEKVNELSNEVVQNNQSIKEESNKNNKKASKQEKKNNKK